MRKVQHGAPRAEGRLELVRSECCLGRHAGPQEDGKRDESAASGHGVDDSGYEAGCEKKGKFQKRDHGLVIRGTRLDVVRPAYCDVSEF